MYFPFTHRSIESIAALAIAFAFSGIAVAADVAMPTKAPVVRPPAIDTWTFSATPYAWVPLLNGSTTVKGRTADVNVDFNDLMDLVRRSEIPKDLFALMGYLEARNGRLSLFTDLVYLKIGLNGSMARSRGVDELNATVGASAGLKFEMFIAELAAAYEVARWGATGAPGSGTAIDVIGGARGWWQKADASLAFRYRQYWRSYAQRGRNALGIQECRLGRSAGRPAAPPPICAGLNFVASGDVGGFGVGSKFSWQALAALNYDFCVRNTVTWSGMARLQGVVSSITRKGLALTITNTT